MHIYIFVYILIVLFSIFDFSIKSQKKKGILLLCSILIIFIGFRNESGADSLNYINYFKYDTDSFSDWKNRDPAYLEWGFYYLSVILKSIFNNIDFYFTVVSIITISFLYKTLKRYCLYPILGMCVYYSRFLILRDMNQIRQALAITILIFALKYLYNNRRKAFVVFTFFSSLMHYSSLSALPFILVFKKKYTTKQYLLLFLLCGISGIILGVLFKKILIAISGVKFLHYLNTTNLGITNPILYYQIFIFYLFSKYENILSVRQKGYYVIRNAYCYSILMLLLTCGLGDIGGRVGTIFATCEIFIIPALCKVIRPRITGYIFSIILTSLLFFMNYLRMMKEPDSWIYF